MNSVKNNDNDMFTSFANPNYNFNEADKINSNDISSTNYYNDNHMFSSSDYIITPTTDTLLSSMLDKNPGGDTLSSNIDQDLVENKELISSESEDNSITGDASIESMATTPSEQARDILEVEHTEEESDNDKSSTKLSGFLGYYASLEQSVLKNYKNFEEESCSDDEEEELSLKKDEAKPLLKNASNKPKLKNHHSYLEKSTYIDSPDSNDSGIQADQSLFLQHQISTNIDDKKPYNDVQISTDQDNSEHLNDEEVEEITEETSLLPPGWQKHEDEDGAYYWHIKSGTIQRNPPDGTSNVSRSASRERRISTSSSVSEASSQLEAVETGSTSSSSTDHLNEFQGHAFKYAAESIKSINKGQSTRPVSSQSVSSNYSKFSANNDMESSQETDSKLIRFAVRSLGWVQIDEKDLTPERSSKAVNRCIVDLSLGRNDINDVVGRWGDGKDLFLDLDEQTLTLSDPQDMSVLNVQPIQSIRVWGVGRDNGRDFAYVARDRMSKRHMCHVFRCDTPARQIANTLRDICKRIMVQRSLAASTTSVGRMHVTRPSDLPNLSKTTDSPSDGKKLTFQNMYKNTSFPTPMEEPKKDIKCHYLGTTSVSAPTGVEVLNSACEKLYAQVTPEKWIFVNVAVAPSTITVTEYGKAENVLTECRVRFLSFMGIAMRNVKLCAFIMHSAQNTYDAYVFHCEPSAGYLCKTIEAACKLRYQKCLDAHHRHMSRTKFDGKDNSNSDKKQEITQSIRNTLKSGVNMAMGMIWKKEGQST